MKACEYVKLAGWDKAKETSELIVKNPLQAFKFENGRNCQGCTNIETISLDELRKLIGSKWVVDYLGGLDACKTFVENKYVAASGICLDDIKNAIKDVESCQ